MTESGVARVSEIVVGVNGSDASVGAVRWAAERAGSRGLRLRLIHVIDEAIAATGQAELLLAVQAGGREILDGATDAARRVSPELDVVADLAQGDIVEVFSALSEDTELLVVGSDGTGGRSARRGVRSLRLAAAATVPVVVVPVIDVSGRRRVVVGVDGSEIGHRALLFAAAEARRLGHTLAAVHAWMLVPLTDYGFAYPDAYIGDFEDAAKELLDRALGSVDLEGIGVERIVEAGDPVFVLAQAAEDAALLVVGSHARGAVARFLLGSVSHGVLGHLEAPTAVVR